MPTSEAQVDEGQVKSAIVEADITGLDADAISKRIDEDDAFAKAYAEGRIVDKGAKPNGDADAGSKAGAPAAPAASGQPASTPANQPGQAPAAKPDAAADTGENKVFTIKAGELPEGFDTPGKVFKSLKEKQAYIDRVQDQVKQRDHRITELEQQLNREKEERQRAATEAQQRASAAGEIDDAKLYDPDFMKEQLKKIQRMDQMEKELAELRTVVNQTKQQEQDRVRISRELDELRAFQAQHPALQTKRPIDEIDRDYGKFVQGIKAVTGATNDDDALKFVSVFLRDKGEDGNVLRAAAEKAGVKAPEELEPYLRVMIIREAAGNHLLIDRGAKQPRHATLDEAFRMTYPDLYVQAGRAAPPAADPRKELSPEEKKAQDKERIRLEAEKLKSGEATEIPPGASGKGDSVDDLSDEQIDELFRMTPDQLRANPSKKKLLDAVYQKINLPALNVNGQRDALL